MSSQSRGEKMMLQRQQQEERRLTFEKVCSYDKKTMANAVWETKTNAKVLETDIKRRFNRLRQTQQARVDVRRQQLADLLAHESEAYAVELMSQDETPEERKSRMEARALELKAKREAERVQFVEDMNYRKWRASCDDLREADSQNFLLACHTERGKQLQEKIDKKEVEHREGMLFDALWEEERLKRAAKDKAQEDDLAAMTSKVQVVMAEQVVAYKSRLEEDRRITEQEVQQQKDLWQQQEQEDRRKATLAAEQQFRRNQALMQFNIEKLKEREEALRVERELDLKFLDMVLRKEAAMDAAEREKKAAYAAAAMQYRTHLVALMQREADDEAYLDELRGAEFEKAWNKRTEVWAREQDARERLMGHVMEERRRQIEDKMARSEAESMEEAQERQRLMEDIDRGAGLDLDHLDRRKSMLSENERILRAQVGEKEMQKERLAAVEMYERRAHVLAERQYQQRLEAEKQRMQSHALSLTGRSLS